MGRNLSGAAAGSAVVGGNKNLRVKQMVMVVLIVPVLEPGTTGLVGGADNSLLLVWDILYLMLHHI